MKNLTSPYVLIKRSSIHSTGAFAKVDIPKDARVIEYVGEKITKAVSNKRADIPLNRNKSDNRYGAVYIFELNKKYDIDGNAPHNTARFINHSCEPNCETEIIKGQIWIIALRNIKKGEELTYDYGYDIDDFEEHRCECGSKRCVGYIVAEEYWPKLSKYIEKKRAKKKTKGMK